MNAADIIDTASTVDILLVPDGEVESVNGNFMVDSESFNLTAKEFDTHGTDLPIDYEHQTLGKQWSSPSGKAPAAGWIRALRYEPGRGIVGQVAWTEEAKAEIRAGKYRYLSPVVIVRKSDGKMVALHSAALTNKPAILDMEKVAARDDTLLGESTMDLKELRAALTAAGVTLDEAADDTAVLTAAKAFVENSAKKISDAVASADALGKLAAKVGASDARFETIVAKLEPLLTDRIPMAEYTRLAEQVKALQKTEEDRLTERLVAKAIDDGLLNPHNAEQMAWAKDYARSPDAFARWMLIAPKSVQTGVLVRPNASLDGAPGDRKTIIAKAASTFDENAAFLGRITTREATINDELRKAGLPVLAKDERN